MNTLTKSIFAFAAAASISTVALAAPGDAHYGNEVRAQNQAALATQAADIKIGVDTNAAFAPTQKATDLNSDRAEFLQNQVN